MGARFGLARSIIHVEFRSTGAGASSPLISLQVFCTIKKTWTILQILAVGPYAQQSTRTLLPLPPVFVTAKACELFRTLDQ
ncbi:hypothetical protein CBM2591_B150002 [Cupriavidus taiwanensis]|nr:hypothetical protein CBM2591_B150002 [Cupriavidus taiwanensis]